MKDTKEILLCPACGEEMKKIRINSAGFFVDACLDGCGGIWLDNRELNKIDEKSEDMHELIESINSKEFKTTDKSQQRICPVCELEMVKNYASTKMNVEIDDCYSCGGKFLDNNELQQIRSEYETDEERTDDVLSLSKSTNKLEDIFHSLMAKDSSKLEELQ